MACSVNVTPKIIEAGVAVLVSHISGAFRVFANEEIVTEIFFAMLGACRSDMTAPKAQDDRRQD